MSSGESPLNTDGSSYTFALQYIGLAADGDKILVVSDLNTNGTANNSYIDPSSATLGGATGIELERSVAPYNASQIFLFDDPGGSNADIYMPLNTGSITVNSTQRGWVVGVYRVANLQSTTPLASGADNSMLGTTLSISLGTTDADGFIVVGGAVFNSSASWGGTYTTPDFSKTATTGQTKLFEAVSGVGTGSAISSTYSATGFFGGAIAGVSMR